MSENSMEYFLIWVSKRKLVTRNNASLRMNSDRSQFVDYRVNDLWCAWQASRQTVVVELPSHNRYDLPVEAYPVIQDCQEAIEAAGLRCEVRS